MVAAVSVAGEVSVAKEPVFAAQPTAATAALHGGTALAILKSRAHQVRQRRLSTRDAQMHEQIMVARYDWTGSTGNVRRGGPLEP